MNLATNTLLTENSQIQEEIDTFIPVKRPTTHILIFKKVKRLGLGQSISKRVN